SSQKLNYLHDFNSPQIEHFRKRPKNISYIKIIYINFILYILSFSLFNGLHHLQVPKQQNLQTLIDSWTK
ncbi:hypothetical protein O0K38_11255, partial [Staphylococcus pseudintermedius]|nr:hypothetical protein [Staphylococcus pseudintermedius]